MDELKQQLQSLILQLDAIEASAREITRWRQYFLDERLHDRTDPKLKDLVTGYFLYTPSDVMIEKDFDAYLSECVSIAKERLKEK